MKSNMHIPNRNPVHKGVHGGQLVETVTLGDLVRANEERGGDLRTLAMLWAAIFDDRLTKRHWVILSTIAESMDDSTGVATQGRQLIADRCPAYTKHGIAKTISELVAYGYLVRTQRQAKPGERARSHYAFGAVNSKRPKPKASSPRPEGRIMQRIERRRALRSRLLSAFDCQCEYCGCRQPDASRLWHIDRIVPATAGGTYDPHNITLACARCNIAKGNRDCIGPVRSLAIMEIGGAHAG